MAFYRATTPKCERVLAEADQAWTTRSIVQHLSVPMLVEGMFEHPIVDERWVGPYLGTATQDPRPSLVMMDFGTYSNLIDSGPLLQRSPGFWSAYLFRNGGRDRVLRPVMVTNIPAREYSRIENLAYAEVARDFQDHVVSADLTERVRLFKASLRSIDSLATMAVDGAAQHAVRIAKHFDIPLLLFMNIGSKAEISDTSIREKIECYMQESVENLHSQTLLKLSIHAPEFTWKKQTELNELINIFEQRGMKMLLAFRAADHSGVTGLRGMGGGIGDIHPLNTSRYPRYEQGVSTSNVGCMYIFLGVTIRTAVSDICERFLQPHHWRLSRAD